MREVDFMSRVMSIEAALAVLALFMDENGVVEVEDKLGGSGHEARLVSTKATIGMTALESAIKYVLNSPAKVFAVNVTKTGTRGRAKHPVADKMFCAFYSKAQILAGLEKLGPAFTVHTNCVTFHKVGIMPMTSTFGLPLCAVECPFGLKDIPADSNPRRAATPYAAFWERWISSTFHGHNVANLNNSRYDMRLVFVD